MTRLLLGLPLALVGSAALAQATPDEAARLTALFQTYLGSTPGVVTVAPEGATYTLTLDATPLIAMLPADAGTTISLSPVVMSLADNGDGTWAVTQDQPMAARLSVPGEVDLTVNVGSISCKGTFDEALQAFAENTCAIGNLDMDQVITDPVSGRMAVAYRVAAMDYTSTATAGADGGVDAVMSYVISGLEETIDLPAAPGAPPQPLRITVDSYAVDGEMRGFRTAEVMALAAWAVAHPGEAAMKAVKAGLRALIEAGLPLWEHLVANGTATGLAVETPVGPVAVAEVGFDVELSGAVEEGYFREALRFSGATPPPGVIPPFAEPLLPQVFGIDVAVDQFDAAAAAQVLLGLFDLPDGQEPGPEFQGALIAALLPEGTVGITLAPGEVSNAMYALTYEGAMTVGPMAPPVGTARVVATGLDDVIAALDGAPPEMTADILPVLGMARGLARPGVDGALEWDIDASQPGTLLVNGMDLMGMQ